MKWLLTAATLNAKDWLRMSLPAVKKVQRLAGLMGRIAMSLGTMGAADAATAAVGSTPSPLKATFANRTALLRGRMPDLEMERAAGGRVAGVDEAGRGPLAGPVVAAAVVLPDDISCELAAMLDDSKKLTADQRLAAYLALCASSAEIGVGAGSVADIARLNILHASMLAMRRAVSRLGVAPDLALVDGNYPPKLPCSVRCVVGGDAKCLSIAAASIVAKVIRDRAMVRLAVRFPGYGWHANVGYATQLHREALRRLGPTRHHREAFGLVAQLRLALTIAD